MKPFLLKISFLLLVLFLTTDATLGQEVVDVQTLDNSNGLKERIINHTVRAPNGYFYLFQNNEIQQFDGSSFIDISKDILISDLMILSDLKDVQLSKNGKIYLQFENQRFLYVLNQKEKAIERINIGNIDQVILSDSIVYHIKKEDGLSTVHYSTYDDYMHRSFAFKTNLEFDEIIKNEKNYFIQNNDEITKISENSEFQITKKGKLLSNTNGLYLFNRNGIFQYQDSQFSKIHSLDLSEPSQCALLNKDDHGNIIASYSNRIRYYHKVFVLSKDHSLSDYSKVLDINDKYKDLFTNDIHDKWMVVGFNGIQIITWLKSGIEFYNKDHSVKKSDFGNLVTAIDVDRNNKMRFVREAKGIYQIEAKSNTAEEIKFNNTRHTGNSKMAYHPESDHHFLFGFRYDGNSNLFKLNFKNKTSEYFEIPIEMHDLLPYSADKVYCVGHTDKYGILGSFDTQTGIFNNILKLDSKLRSISYFPSYGQYWIGAYEGLFVYDEDFKLIDQFDHLSTIADKVLLKDHIVMVAEFNNKMIVGSYGGGIYVIDRESMKVIKHLSDDNGLSDNNAIGIIKDDLGNLWVSTFNGLNVIDSSFNVIKVIYDYEGLPNREFNSKACAKDAEGYLYFGSLNGLAKVDPKQVLKWTYSEGLTIESVLSYKDNQLPVDITNRPTFLKSIDSLVINYNSPDYYHHPNYTSSVKYTVLKDQCTVHSSPSNLTLTNIRAGQFNLELHNADKTHYHVLKLKSKKDYELITKIISILMVFGLISFFIVSYIIDTTKKVEADKTKLNKRISELRLNALQSQMNPHFIFNALGSIQYFIHTKDIKKADKFLTNFAKLMRQILESSKSKYVTIQDELKLIQLYLGLEQVRFEDKFDFEIIISPEMDTELKIPPMIIQPFIENSINHGLFNLIERPGKIIIRVENIDLTKINIVIEDNGIGRSKAKEMGLKKHKSRATEIINERIETFNANNDLSIEVETIDLFNDLEAVGTKVSIILTY